MLSNFCRYLKVNIIKQHNKKLCKLHPDKSLEHESKWNDYAQRKLLRKNKPFSLNLSGNNLNGNHIGYICEALLNRYYPLNLIKLDLSINHNISDLCAKLLFKCIGDKCHKLQCIDLSYANITDLSCDIIYNFYFKYFLNKTNHTHLHKIDLSFTRISENGLIILDKLYNELPSKCIDHQQIKYIHNKSSSSTSSHESPSKSKSKSKSKTKSKHSKTKKSNNIHPWRNSNSSIEYEQFNDDVKEQSIDYTEIEINESDKDKENIDPFNKIIRSKHRKQKSQSFEIVLKGCFFEPMLCKNYICLAAIPKLQTHCCIKLRPYQFFLTYDIYACYNYSGRTVVSWRQILIDK